MSLLYFAIVFFLFHVIGVKVLCEHENYRS